MANLEAKMTVETKHPDVAAQFDQMDAELSNLAIVVANFYRSLLQHGMPEEFARGVTFDVYNRFMSGTYTLK